MSGKLLIFEFLKRRLSSPEPVIRSGQSRKQGEPSDETNVSNRGTESHRSVPFSPAYKSGQHSDDRAFVGSRPTTTPRGVRDVVGDRTRTVDADHAQRSCLAQRFWGGRTVGDRPGLGYHARPEDPDSSTAGAP